MVVQIIVSHTVAVFGLHTSVADATDGNTCVWAEGVSTSIPKIMTAASSNLKVQTLALLVGEDAVDHPASRSVLAPGIPGAEPCREPGSWTLSSW